MGIVAKTKVDLVRENTFMDKIRISGKDLQLMNSTCELTALSVWYYGFSTCVSTVLYRCRPKSSHLINRVDFLRKSCQMLQKVLVTVPKKGDLSDCRNYKGIMLLSIPSKVFTRVLQDRINKKLDTAMRRQQAGFRPHRSCVDQMNTLRTIVGRMESGVALRFRRLQYRFRQHF